MSAIFDVHVGVLDAESAKRRRGDHIQRVARQPKLTCGAPTSADGLEVQMSGVHSGVVFREHLRFGDQLQVAFPFVLLVGPKLHLVARFERIDKEARVADVAALDVVERIREEGEHGVVEHQHIPTFGGRVGAELDEHRVERCLARGIDLTLIVADALAAALAVHGILGEGGSAAAVTQFDDGLVAGQAAPGGPFYAIISGADQTVVANQGVCLDHDLGVTPRVGECVKLEHAEGLDHGRLQHEALVASFQPGVTVEGEAGGVVQVGAWCFAAAAARCLTGGGASGRVEEHVFRPVALVCLRFEEEPVAAYVFAVQQAVRRRRSTQTCALTAGIYQIFVHIDPIRGHGRKSAAADGLRAAIARHVGGEGELQIASLIFVRVQIAVKSVVITSAIHPAGIAYASSDGLTVPFFVVGAKK